MVARHSLEVRDCGRKARLHQVLAKRYLHVGAYASVRDGGEIGVSFPGISPSQYQAIQPIQPASDGPRNWASPATALTDPEAVESCLRGAELH